jgi:hypothetical protein
MTKKHRREKIVGKPLLPEKKRFPKPFQKKRGAGNMALKCPLFLRGLREFLLSRKGSSPRSLIVGSADV